MVKNDKSGSALEGISHGLVSEHSNVPADAWG